MNTIPLRQPCFGPEEVEALQAVARSGAVLEGPNVGRFEQLVAGACHAPHAVAVSNVGIAMRLAWSVLGIGPGDEVICPALTSMATVDSLRTAGARPVFAGVDPRTYTLTPEAVEPLVNERTEAILVTHQFGLPVDLDGLRALADDRGLRLVEDAGAALGSRYRGRPVGMGAELACFSFDSSSPVTTGQGAVVTTTSAAFAQCLRSLRDRGDRLPDTVDCVDAGAAWGACLDGYCAMTEIQAALGVVQIRRLEDIVARHRELAACYARALADLPWLHLPTVPTYAQPNFQSFVVQLAEGAPRSRDELARSLRRSGIATAGIAMGEMPTHSVARRGSAGSRLAAWIGACRRSLLLPIAAEMSAADLHRVVAALRSLGRPHRGELPRAAERTGGNPVPEWPVEERSPPLCAES